MKNLLQMYKDTLIKAACINHSYNESKIISFYSKIDIKTADVFLERIPVDGKNSYIMNNNMVYFYPKNDGFSVCPLEFCKDKRRIKVIDNQRNFLQITNLEDILIKMINVIDLALDNNVIINSYDFVLELKDDIKSNYEGSAELVLPSSAIVDDLQLSNIERLEAQKHFLNYFLDHFLGWNFGYIIDRSPRLQSEIERFNNKVIDLKLREAQKDNMISEILNNENNPDGFIYYYKIPVTKTKELRNIS